MAAILGENTFEDRIWLQVAMQLPSTGGVVIWGHLERDIGLCSSEQRLDILHLPINDGIAVLLGALIVLQLQGACRPAWQDDSLFHPWQRIDTWSYVFRAEALSTGACFFYLPPCTRNTWQVPCLSVARLCF